MAKKKQTPAFDVESFLRSWASVQTTLSTLTKEQIEQAIDVEKNGKQRATILARLATRHARLSKSEHIKELLS